MNVVFLPRKPHHAVQRGPSAIAEVLSCNETFKHTVDTCEFVML